MYCVHACDFDLCLKFWKRNQVNGPVYMHARWRKHCLALCRLSVCHCCFGGEGMTRSSMTHKIISDITAPCSFTHNALQENHVTLGPIRIASFCVLGSKIKKNKSTMTELFSVHKLSLLLIPEILKSIQHKTSYNRSIDMVSRLLFHPLCFVRKRLLWSSLFFLQVC